MINTVPARGRNQTSTSDEALHSIVDLFAGISGVATGFCDSGRFRAALLIDIDEAAQRAFVFNHPRQKNRFVRADISTIKAKDIILAAGRKPTGLVGCPPCQGLSDVGVRRHVDRRNHLIDHYFRLVRSLRPQFFVMENVPKVLTYGRFRKQLHQTSRWYNIWSGVLNASDYGLPQTRQRAIVIGYRKSLKVYPTAPQPTHCGSRKVFAYDLQRLLSPADRAHRNSVLGRYARARGISSLDTSLSELPPLVTCRDALSDLPRANQGSIVPYPCAPTTPYQENMRRRARGVLNHTRWGHGPEMRKKMSRLKPGQSPLSKVGRAKHRYFSQAYARLHPRGLARTITTNFHNPGAGRFWHYLAQRTLTIREAARLQSFPDRFIFPDDIPRTVQERLIGNAFPPLLAKSIASHIHLEIGHLL
jgi:DNA (cytosine-5)-methyltransferase 1